MSPDRGKTVCFYSVSTHLGGAERSLLDLVARLEPGSDGRYRPWVLLPQEAGPLIDELKIRGVEHSVLPMPKGMLRMSRQTPAASVAALMLGVGATTSYAARLTALVKRRRPAIVHTTGIKCHAIAAWLRPAHRAPVLWHLRDILAPGATLQVLRATARLPGVSVIANSEATAKAFARSGIKVIHNGLDSSLAALPRDAAFKKELGFSENAPLVGIIGVLAKWKGQLDFIDAAARLIAGGSRANFVIVGDQIYDTAGDRGYRQALEAAIARAGLGDRVRLAGFRKDVPRVLQSLDVLVHASSSPEPFGRVILEAMAVGVPVVATGLGGVRELLTDEIEGLLVEPRDAAAIERQIRRFLEDPVLRTRCVSAAREKFLSRFTIESHVAKVVEFYDEVLKL